MAPIPLIIAMVVITAAAAAAQAAAQKQQAAQAAAVQRHNAQLQGREYQQQAFAASNQALGFEQQAGRETEVTQFEVAQRADAAGLAQAKDAALIASSGVEMSGSPLLAYLHNVRARELDTQLLVMESTERKLGFESQAAQARFQARELGQAGVLAIQGGRSMAQGTEQVGKGMQAATLVGGLAQAASTGVSGGISTGVIKSAA